MYSNSFERNFKDDVSSYKNQLNKNLRLFSSLIKDESLLDKSNNNTLDPWFITGFVDGEGSFIIAFRKKSGLNPGGYRAEPRFSITLNNKDLALLYQIQSYFDGIGNIIEKSGKDTSQFYVSSIKQINSVIIPHFEKYPLITKKFADYKLFKQALELMQSKEHLTEAGFRKIIEIKASMNWGLSDELNSKFPEIIPMLRPLVLDNKIPHPEWMAGFTSGEGSFMVRVKQSSNLKGWNLELKFQITQHTKDAQLLASFQSFFGCGKYKEKTGGLSGDFYVGKFPDLYQKIIPFFVKYYIRGIKAKNFEDFVKIAELVQSKTHLSNEGIEQIRNIQMGMNKKRKE